MRCARCPSSTLLHWQPDNDACTEGWRGRQSRYDFEMSSLASVSTIPPSTHQLAGEGQDRQVESQAHRQPCIRLGMPHKLEQLGRALKLGCEKWASTHS